jgi:hypothetical protein
MSQGMDAKAFVIIKCIRDILLYSRKHNKNPSPFLEKYLEKQRCPALFARVIIELLLENSSLQKKDWLD